MLGARLWSARYALSLDPPPGPLHMPKLIFKRTPEEEAEHHARKARRKERKKRKRTDHSQDASKRSRRATDDDVTSRRWASSDEGEDDVNRATASAPHSRASKADDERADGGFSQRVNDEIRAEMEERTYREKLFDAMGHDERLDGLENELNDFVHIPDRWKTAATGTAQKELYDKDNFLKLDPSALDDDEYAEWVRLGMYRYAFHTRFPKVTIFLILVTQEKSRC